MINALLRLGGVALTGAVFVTVVLSIVLAVTHLVGRRRSLARRDFRFAASAVMIQLTALLAGPVVARHRALDPAADLAMCELDCDLRVGGVHLSRGDSVTVSVRMHSDARRTNEWPGAIRFRLVDSSGRRYEPTHAASWAPLGAGATRRESLQFVLPADVMPVRLEATWGSVMDYLVPGPEHPWVKRKTAFELPIVAAS